MVGGWFGRRSAGDQVTFHPVLAEDHEVDAAVLSTSEGVRLLAHACSSGSRGGGAHAHASSAQQLFQARPQPHHGEGMNLRYAGLSDA